MAITFPATTLADGALISKTFIDMVVDDINHLVDRPDGFNAALQSGQTATTSTYTQLSTPTFAFTPKRTGKALVLVTLALMHSAGGVNCNARIDFNGSKGNIVVQSLPTIATRVTWFDVIAVTTDVAYTLKAEFSNPAASGTITAVNLFPAHIFAIEIGA